MKEKADYASDCYKGGFIAVGWSRLRDVQMISRAELFEQLMQEYGGSTASVAAKVSSVWSFYHDVSVGDLVVCPDKYSGRYYGGQIVGPAFRERNTKTGACPFAHRRKVKWFGSAPSELVRERWGGSFAGQQTVSRVSRVESEFPKIFGRRRRIAVSRQSSQTQPDAVWGRKVEERALIWLESTRKQKAIDVSKENKGWDIECGGELFEVKGRKSIHTKIRLTDNEWRAAVKHQLRYTVLLFTAVNERALRRRSPREFPNPAETESWTKAVRTTYEYFLEE